MSAREPLPASPGAARRRLARTFTRARWSEYAALLRTALGRSYRILALEAWVRAPDQPGPVLILRHDVDQHPRAVRPLLAAERAAGVSSTWYFRWRTADPRVIEEVRSGGGDVGLHYETLTRRALASNGAGVTAGTVAACREELRAEIASFKQLFGPISSICPHGDSRVPGVDNRVLVDGIDPATLGVEFDGNEELRRRTLGAWLTDRSAPDGRWKPGMDPEQLLAGGVSPLLCLTHPNNLASGPGLWFDRIAAHVLPEPVPGERARLPRTRPDDPPSYA